MQLFGKLNPPMVRAELFPAIKNVRPDVNSR